MPQRIVRIALFAVIACAAHAEDLSRTVKKAIERSTLDQPGTHPFHLKAIYSPSLDRDKDSNRNGSIEYWWQSPTKFRREVSAPGFHQVLIVDADHQWQQNDSDFFPEWLREIAIAVVRPVPIPIDALLSRVKTAEVRRMASIQTNIDWPATPGPGSDEIAGKGHLAMNEDTALLYYTGGPGWDAQFKDFRDFHGRDIARKVSSGSPEVTAIITTLEDLAPTPATFFDTTAPAASTPIQVIALSESHLRESLQPLQPITWPPVINGPFEGVVWTTLIVDRTGKVREMHQPVSDNPALRDAAAEVFRAMQFTPVLRDGQPVQAIGRISLPFKTARPAGTESFDSARNYFDRGRKASMLSVSSTAPYSLRAEFQTRDAKGEVATGRYEDTWLSPTQWKREAWFGSAHLVRSLVGDKHFVLSEGAEIPILRIVMSMVEPIPAPDTMTESDWRIRRDPVNSTPAIRVFRGPEGPNGELDPNQSQGFWFDDHGQLLKSVASGLEIRRSSVTLTNGVPVAYQLDALKSGKVALHFTVKEVTPADPATLKSFTLKGHEWQRQFTAEVR